MKLYEINSAIESLIENSVNEETGEINETTSQELDKLYSDKLQKISDLVLVIKNKDSFTSQIDEEIKKLQAKKRAVQNKVDWLKRYLESNLVKGEKIEGANFTISWRKSSSIEIDESAQLDELHTINPTLVRQEIIYKADKNEAKRLYKETGILPEGFRLIEKQNLEVR